MTMHMSQSLLTSGYSTTLVLRGSSIFAATADSCCINLSSSLCTAAVSSSSHWLSLLCPSPPSTGRTASSRSLCFRVSTSCNAAIGVFDIYKHPVQLQSLSTNKCTYYTNIYFILSGSYMFQPVAILRELTTK